MVHAPPQKKQSPSQSAYTSVREPAATANSFPAPPKKTKTTMKTLFLILGLALFAPSDVLAQSTFELEPSQSMLMTGKGPGQDGALNPYAGEDCYAVVQNTGRGEFSIRIQQDGKIIETIPVARNEEKKVALPKGYELYLDTGGKGKASATVDFEQMNPKKDSE